MSEAEDFEFRLRMEREAQPTSTPSPQPASMGDTIAGLPLTRLAMGAASPLIGAAQLGAHVGDVANRAMGVEPVVSPWIDAQLARYKAAKERGMKAAGDEGYDWMGLLGSLAPTSLVAKGLGAALPQASSVLGRAGVGAVQGGVAAAAQPVENTDQGFWSPKGIQAGIGTMVGGAVPLAIDAGKGLVKIVSQAAQPFTEKGRAEILNEFQHSLMGNDPATKQKVVQALLNAKQIVPGSAPTAGEALAEIPEATGLAAHQKDIARLPGVSPLFAQRGAEQEAARAGAIGQIAQTPAALEQAVQARNIEAAQKYGLAAQQTVRPDHVFETLMDRPSMQQAAKRAANLAQEAGQTFDPTSVQSLHYMKMAMDDIIKDPKTFGIGASEAQAMEKTQGAFVKWLGQQSPAYNIARTSYKAASEPINRMQVGQELEKTLTNPLGTSERGAMFAKAVEDAPRTIKRATGQQMFDKLEEVLPPTQAQAVRNVSAELARKDAFDRLARGTKVSGADAIPGEIGLPLPNLLWRPSMIANFMMKHFAKGAEDKIAQVAAGQYLNPKDLATALQSVPPRYQPMIDALMQQLPAAAGTLAGRSQ